MERRVAVDGEDGLEGREVGGGGGREGGGRPAEAEAEALQRRGAGGMGVGDEAQRGLEEPRIGVPDAATCETMKRRV